MINEELFPYEAEILSHTEIYHEEELQFLFLAKPAAPWLLYHSSVRSGTEVAGAKALSLRGTEPLCSLGTEDAPRDNA